MADWVLAQIPDSVRKECGSGHGDFPARPAGMVGGVVERFGVRHQAEDMPGRVRQAGNGQWRTVGIPRMLLRSFARFRMRILQSNQVFVLQPLQGRGIAGHELAFAMTDRHRQHTVDSQSFGENTRAVGVRLELDPSVLIAGGVVMAEGNLPLKTLPVQRGEYAELDEQLESIADSQHEAARIDEPVQAVQQRLAFRVGKMQPAL